MKLRLWFAFYVFLIGIVPAVQAANDIYGIVSKEDTAAFSDMMALGYSIDEQDRDGYTPLMIAAANGKVNFAGFLIDNGANINKRYYLGGTAMHRAAFNGHNDIVIMLLDAGAQVNMPDLDGMTPLMMAVKNGKSLTVELLVARGANVNFRNAVGKTALDIAYQYHHQDIAEFLKKSGGHLAPQKKSVTDEAFDFSFDEEEYDDGLGWDTFYK